MLRKLFYIFSLVILFHSNNVVAASNSPIGYWKTVDDVSGDVQSIIQIYETPDHTLAGKILQTFPKPGIPPLVKCHRCKGELKDQPILGMTILKGLKSDGAKAWVDGSIIDPRSGSVYHCLVTLAPQGDQLMIRGFVLFHWLGRSQTWLRTDPA
jgi:uncharacterized protein (DUF2147 family)